VGKNRLPVAVLPLAKLEVQGREALRPRALLCGRHFQALGASCRASDEGEEQRVGAPGEESPRRLGTEDLGQEEDAPALGFVETALIIAHSHYLARGDEVQVARLYPPLPITQPHRAAASLDVGEHEEVVGVRVRGRLARGSFRPNLMILTGGTPGAAS